MKETDEVKTRLVYETEDDRYIWESPYMDVSMEDILDAFFGMMVSATWQPGTILDAMYSFIIDHDYLLNPDEPSEYEMDGDDECGDCGEESEFTKDVEDEPVETKTRLSGKIATPNWPPSKEQPHFYA